MIRLFAFFLFLSPISLFSQTIDELLVLGRKQMEEYQEPAALITFSKILEKDANHYEALWRASFMGSRVGNRIDDEETKKQYFTTAKGMAKKAVQVNPNDAEGYFVLAVAAGRMALVSGSKEKVAASTEIKENAQLALKFNPKHPGAWHIFGRWNHEVTNLNFAERAAANVLFGGLPEGASEANAINCFKNAITYRPDYILYMYDLADAYYSDGQRELAKVLCSEVIAMKPVTPDDPQYQLKAKVLLAKLN